MKVEPLCPCKSTMRFRFLSIALPLLLLALVLTSCAANRPKRIALAEQFGLGYAPLDIMRAKGFLEAELESAGLQGYSIEWKRLVNTAAIREAMLSGDVDVGFVAIPPFLIGRSNGMDWKIISGISRAQIALCSRAPGVQSIADLRSSHRIALPQLGSIQHILLKMELERLALAPDALDANIVVQSHPDGSNLFAQDADLLHLTAPPFVQQNLALTDASSILDGERAFGGPFTFVVGIAPRRFHDDAAAYAAVDRALRRAVAFMNEEPEESIATLLERYEYDEEFLRRLFRDKALQYSAEIEGLERFYEFMLRESMIEPLDLKDLIWEAP
ncbi:MAG: ABC transporter substrate-binding protein [Bacillota bacterium]|nr:ABC transporter substrate-binding protein [Bacillota bacterium]